MQKIGDIAGSGADANGEFQTGDPTLQVPATMVDVQWLNTIQRELVAVLQAAGITPDPADDAQLQQAIAKKADAKNANLTGTTTVEGVTETSPAANTATIDLAVGTVFNYTAATAIILPAVAAGKSFTVVCSAPPTSWAGTVAWVGGSAPTPTAGKGCVFVFVANADATAWYGAMSMDNL